MNTIVKATIWGGGETVRSIEWLSKKESDFWQFNLGLQTSENLVEWFFMLELEGKQRRMVIIIILNLEDCLFVLDDKHISVVSTSCMFRTSHLWPWFNVKYVN